MGLFDWDGGSVISKRSHHSHKSHKSHDHKHHHKHKSRSRSRDRGRHSSSGLGAIFGVGDDGHHKHHHNASRGSFFGLPNVSTRSFFGMSAPPLLSPSPPSSPLPLQRPTRSPLPPKTGKPSYYKRSPRGPFLSRAYKKLKRLLRDLVYYAKRHPVKVFMLVIMPLLTGGALTALLARFGLRMPAGLERMVGIGAKAMTGDGIGLVGEAVRMAGGLGAGGGSVHLERGRAGDMQWERKSVDRDSGGGGAWGGLGGALGGMGTMAKMFL